ncbi:MAG: triose-phosphate isomerase [bacterium]|nr:triose-phosphate isomerase [bacterium]MDZ4299701.1 triose-phosphate isomerase [Candidatus Sungbacteria bacterium]
MKKILIIANWKAHPATLAEACTWAERIEAQLAVPRSTEVVIAPPSPFLSALGDILKKAHLGAQDVFWEDVGPYTGAVSWRHLAELGVRTVIVGHSERRRIFGETDEGVNRKVRALIAADMMPVVCVGETERDGSEIPRSVEEQVRAALVGVRREDIVSVALAYEPVWAISTTLGARAADPEMAFRARLSLKKTLVDLYGGAAADRVRIIYGGSVTGDSLASFIKEGRMDGALVGRASLDPDGFVRMIRSLKGT